MKPHKVFEDKIRRRKYKNAASAIGNINRAAREGKISEGMRNRLNRFAQKCYATCFKKAQAPNKAPLKTYVWNMGADGVGVIIVLARSENEAKSKARKKLPKKYHCMLRHKNLHIVGGTNVLVAEVGSVVR